MSKVIGMDAKGKAVYRINTTAAKPLFGSTTDRVKMLRTTPKKLRYNYMVESLNMLDEWDKFIAETGGKVFGSKVEDVEVTELEYNKAAYFVYFFGSFYKHNGQPADQPYVGGAYTYLHLTIGYKDGAEDFDQAEFFYRAFPEKRPA